MFVAAISSLPHPRPTSTAVQNSALWCDILLVIPTPRRLRFGWGFLYVIILSNFITFTSALAYLCHIDLSQFPLHLPFGISGGLQSILFYKRQPRRPGRNTIPQIMEAGLKYFVLVEGIYVRWGCTYV
ncbi:hypothetical protein HOY82DRAFT_4797 [Tuber indicum]|nr:hypothetical protein HOY82DRAFT_4797 [Tuber indicum]